MGLVQRMLGKVSSLALEGLPLPIGRGAPDTPLPSLPSVFLRTPQGLPLLGHFVF